jgi:purine-nucleoside phosphorylase
MSQFDQFRLATEQFQPRGLIVLGSGLSEVASHLELSARVGFGQIPGLVPPTVQGHKGELLLGTWNQVPILLSLGRVHSYEGHSVERVTRLVNLAADLGVENVILTNAAGGIRSDLKPGSLMPIKSHWKLLGREAWKDTNPTVGIYDTSWPSDTEPGIYAALTGPNYETPAEIRALRALGADAVGMSTAREAEAALARGMRVFGISCITNVAAGLAEGTLNHVEVEQNAKLAIVQMRSTLSNIISRF